MKKSIFAFIIGAAAFVSCTPEYVNLKMIDNGELILNVYNEICASYGDTVLYQEYYTEDGLPFSGKNFEYSLVTDEQFKKNRKREQWHYGINEPSAEYPDWKSKKITARRAVVVKP